MLFTGVDLLTLSQVLEDSRERYTAATPGAEIPVASIEPPGEGSFQTVYKDGMAINSYPVGSDQSFKISVAAIAPDELQKILNDEEGAYIDTGLSSIKHYALSFRIRRNDGSFDYYAFLKGNIIINAKTVETRQGTAATVDSITYTPLTTRHIFAYNGAPCRKMILNDRRDGVIESGWRAVQWTPDSLLPVPAPLISLEDLGESVKVVLAPVREGDIVRYTIDGTTPTLESPVYEAPFTVTLSATIRAIACSPSMHVSAVAEARIEDYILPPPIVEVVIAETASVKISSTVPGVTIRYTIDGSEPNSTSPVYTAPLAVVSNTIKAYCEKPGYIRSETVTTPINVKLPQVVIFATKTSGGDSYSLTVDRETFAPYGDVYINWYFNGSLLARARYDQVVSVYRNGTITAVATCDNYLDSEISDPVIINDIKAQSPIITFS